MVKNFILSLFDWKQGKMSAFSILRQHSAECSSQYSKARKRNKKHRKGKIRKEEIK